MRIITDKQILMYKEHLICEEKSISTVSKYVHDIIVFAKWLDGRHIDKSIVLSYKAYLTENYSPASVNSALSSINSFFSYNEWHELKVKSIKIQQKVFVSGEKELTKNEYVRLLNAAKSEKDDRMYLIMQTICATGIRVSELKYISVEAIKTGRAEINCKGKQRSIFIPARLCKMLQRYALSRNINAGAVFVTKNGNPVDRSNIWSDMKKLCRLAAVPETKVFPHNLRHLFARTYYSEYKDVVRLADILGHSSVNTTRIYTVESGETHRRQIQKLDLLLC